MIKYSSGKRCKGKVEYMSTTVAQIHDNCLVSKILTLDLGQYPDPPRPPSPPVLSSYQVAP